MEVTYIANSCFVYKTPSGKKLVTDPWFDGPCNQTWFHFPPVEVGLAKALTQNPDWIYISHLHEDHLHERSLGHFPRDTTIVIGKLNTPHLANKIRSFGFSKLIELETGKKHNFEGLQWIIFKDFNGSSVGDISELGYDLDTSLWIQDESGCSVFNAIDNSLLPHNSKELRNQFGTPDLAILPYASASMYPMSMLDYPSEKKLLIANEFKKKFATIFYENAANLGAKLIIPAGGEYLLGADAAQLAIYQPIPIPADFEMDAPEVLRSSIQKLYFGDKLDVHSGETIKNINATYRNFTTENLVEYSASLSSIQADYRAMPLEESCDWKTLLQQCADNYLSATKRRGLSLNFNVRVLLNDLNIDVRFDTPGELIDKSIEFQLPSALFYQIATGKLNWNNLESSCLIGLRRFPDSYCIDLHNSMVFFRRPSLLST